MSTKDGGLAFPGERYELEEECGTRILVTYPGMTLRDYFAAKVMEGMIINEVDATNDVLAVRSYVMADAMLKARNR